MHKCWQIPKTAWFFVASFPCYRHLKILGFLIFRLFWDTLYFKSSWPSYVWIWIFCITRCIRCSFNVKIGPLIRKMYFQFVTEYTWTKMHNYLAKSWEIHTGLSFFQLFKTTHTPRFLSMEYLWKVYLLLKLRCLFGTLPVHAKMLQGNV